MSKKEGYDPNNRSHNTMVNPRIKNCRSVKITNYLSNLAFAEPGTLNEIEALIDIAKARSKDEEQRRRFKK